MWIARERNGLLRIYTEKPVRREVPGIWYLTDNSDCVTINSSWFQDISWEDEPVEVNIILKNQKPIDEEKLDEIAYNYACSVSDYDEIVSSNDIATFKAEYRKALEKISMNKEILGWEYNNPGLPKEKEHSLSELKNKIDIEERAKEAQQNCNADDEFEAIYYGLGYKKGATEQDSISRADERKKCIEKAWVFFIEKYPINLDMCNSSDLENYKVQFKQVMED